MPSRPLRPFLRAAMPSPWLGAFSVLALAVGCGGAVVSPDPGNAGDSGGNAGSSTGSANTVVNATVSGSATGGTRGGGSTGVSGTAGVSGGYSGNGGASGSTGSSGTSSGSAGTYSGSTGSYTGTVSGDGISTSGTATGNPCDPSPQYRMCPGGQIVETTYFYQNGVCLLLPYSCPMIPPVDAGQDGHVISDGAANGPEADASVDIVSDASSACAELPVPPYCVVCGTAVTCAEYHDVNGVCILEVCGGIVDPGLAWEAGSPIQL